MKIYNETKTEILESVDSSLGHIKDDILEVIIPSQEKIEEKWHYETIRQYPNGGKSVKKIIDVKGQPFIEAHIEKEKIQVFIPYTQKELNQKEIMELKAKLKQYDYIGTKIATGRATREEYSRQIMQMTEWANRINELEQNI